MVQESLREAMHEDTEDEIERDQYLVFSGQYQEFGIQAMRIQEIVPLSGMTKVPSAPPHIEGILNLRGRLVSVIDFRKRFGFPPKDHDEDTRIIMVEHHGFPTGVIVDSVAEVIRIPDEKVQQLPEYSTVAVMEGYITGVGMLDKRLVILLDIDRILSAN